MKNIRHYFVNEVDLFMNILPLNELPQSKVSIVKLIGGKHAFLQSQIKRLYTGGYSTFRLKFANKI